MQFISEINTIGGQKRRQRQNKLSESLTEKTESINLLNEAYNIEGVCKQEESINFLNESSKIKNKNRTKLKEKEDFLNEKTEKALNYFFLRLMEKSLLIEPEMLSLNKDEIKEKVIGFRKVMAPETKIVKGSFIARVYECVDTHVKDLYELEDKEVIKESLNKMLNYYVGELAPILREKVSNVIAEEKILSECIDLRQNNIIGKDVKQSLFKKIQLENIKLALTEFNSQILTEDIMNSSFYETIVDYTLLEVYNTLGLFGDIDLNGVRHNLQKNYTQF